MAHSFSFFLLLVFMSLFVASGAVAEDDTENLLDSNSANATNRYVDGEQLILKVKTKRYELGQIFGVIEKSDLFLDLNEMFTIIDFPIQSNGNRYEGWYINESNQFLLDFSPSARNENGQVEVMLSDTTRLLNPSDYVQVDGQIMIRYSTLSNWFGLNLNIDYANLVLLIKPDSALPFQIRLARQSNQINGTTASKVARFPHLYRGYGLLSSQTLDAQIGLFANDNNHSTRYSILGRRDIGLVNSRFFITGFADDLVKNASLTFSRESNQNDLLGIFKASSVEVGDVNPVNVGGLGGSPVGRGLFVTNRDLYQSFNFETVDLTGEIDLNWDVELYRNDILIDKQINVTTGRYEFQNIQLFFGQNNMELWFYGPQGQFKKESYQQLVNASTKFDRKLDYSLSLVQVNKNLLNTLPDTENDQGFALSGQYRVGVSSNLTMQLSHQHLFGGDQNSNSVSAGATGRLFKKILWNTNVAMNDNDSFSAGTGIRTALGRHNFSFNYSYSKTLENSGRSSFAFTNSGKFSDIAYQNNARYQEIDDAISRYTLNNNIGFTALTARFSHELEYTKEENTEDNTQLDSLVGFFNVQKALGRTLGRIGISYSDIVEDNFRISSVNASLSWAINDKWSSVFDYKYLPYNGVDSFKAGLQYRNGIFFLNSDLQYFENDNWLFGLNARVSLSYSDQSEQVYFKERSSANLGTVFVRVFIDKNGNAIYDKGEFVVENAPVKSVQSHARAVSDSDGVASLTGLATQKKTDIYVDVKKIDEPFLTPLIQGFSITPRAGVAHEVDFPLVYFSEIEGTVLTEFLDGSLKEAVNRKVELWNVKTGKLIQTVRTEFDGYFFISQVIPGKYRLTISESNLNRNQFTYSDIAIEVISQAELFSDQELRIKEIKHSKGYLTVIAEFDSKEKAVFYTKVLAKTPAKKLLKGSAIIDDLSPNKVTIATGYYKAVQKAEAVCDSHTQIGLSCRVIEYLSNN